MILYVFFIDGYALIAVNTTVNCSLLGIGCSNRKKRKVSECNDENVDEIDWVPIPKSLNVNNILLIFNKICIYINNLIQFQLTRHISKSICILILLSCF